MHSATGKGRRNQGKLIFCMRELHTLFAMFRDVGKYTDESSLDGIFCRAGIYEPSRNTCRETREKVCGYLHDSILQHNGYHAG